MGKSEKKKNGKSVLTSVQGFFKGLKSEFKKIIWPDKESLGRQTVAVLVVSIVLCVVIRLLDMIMQYGIGFLETMIQ